MSNDALFSEANFWQKVKSLPAESYCALLQTALTLYALLISGELTKTQSIAIIVVLGYFISPVDALPDVLPLLGYSDDVSLLMATLQQFQSEVTPAMRAKVVQWLPYRCQQRYLSQD